MVTAPPPTPVTVPVDEPTVAIKVLLLVHDPPVVAMLSVVVVPTQMWLMPVMDGGAGLTVMIFVMRQPEPIL